MQKGKYRITVDNFELDEDSGYYYRLRRWAFRPVDGTIYVTFRLHKIGAPEELWDMDHADVFYETLDFPAECVNSDLTSRNSALGFKLQTVKYLDLKQFLDHILNFFYSMEDSGTTSVVDTLSRNYPF